MKKLEHIYTTYNQAMRTLPRFHHFIFREKENGEMHLESLVLKTDNDEALLTLSCDELRELHAWLSHYLAEEA